MEENARIKARKNLFNITSNLAYDDYYNTNYNKNGKRKRKKHIPYNLGYETREAHEIELLAMKQAENITKEEEEKIKAYILKYKLIDENNIYLLDNREYIKTKYNK